jgi:2-iminobutanoate/2-iminopropanoate deaminase
MKERKIIKTTEAPEPIGPYNQAVFINDTLYVSGQIALNPENQTLVTTNIKDETRQVMKNLEAILLAANFTFLNVVKCTIFLKNMNDFPEVNEIYGQFFSEQAPARETVAVKTLPKDVNVEISCIAIA